MNNAELEMMRIYAVEGPSPVHVSPVREIFRRQCYMHKFCVDDFLPEREPAATGQHNFTFWRNRRSGGPPIERLHREFYVWAASQGYK
jgi:hypothetical protein